ncbi:MAG: TIGR03557 family F420-dependent LLM class oxidoreductase [Solirubrobacterales bacterium]|nr:TIGR03557 family F420-dependent LLM class oxidoreductase [Solirubrobacterales bacterium]
MRIGYFLSSEEWGPHDLIAQAIKAREAGFESLWISDHFHPWNNAQAHSPFVWSTIGALSQAVPGMHVTTAVTCPTVRIHPAVIAQAAATSAVLLHGNFSLGVGTGEALNERVLGDSWPDAPERREMLDEAVTVIRKLWRGGIQSHQGKHYTVKHAQIYDLPARQPKIIVSGFGPRSVELAARIGDGFASVGPDADAVAQFRERSGDPQRPVQGGLKVCWSESEDHAVETAHRLWANESLPGELAQILPTPEHFEQANQLVTKQAVAEDTPCGPDLDAHLEAIAKYRDAGFDELYINQIGPEQDAFFDVYAKEVLPTVRAWGEPALH